MNEFKVKLGSSEVFQTRFVSEVVVWQLV